MDNGFRYDNSQFGLIYIGASGMGRPNSGIAYNMTEFSTIPVFLEYNMIDKRSELVVMNWSAMIRMLSADV